MFNELSLDDAIELYKNLYNVERDYIDSNDADEVVCKYSIKRMYRYKQLTDWLIELKRFREHSNI